MITIDLKQGGHKWEKQNNVTLRKGRTHYDIMKCVGCGIEGRTNSIATIALKSSYSEENIYKCKAVRSEGLPLEIEITICRAVGPAFKNLIPGSKHLVITPPVNEKNDRFGVWVNGVGEPVKVLYEEFKVVR